MSICNLFFANPSLNPRTGHKIKIGGPTYQSLVSECGPPPISNIAPPISYPVRMQPVPPSTTVRLPPPITIRQPIPPPIMRQPIPPPITMRPPIPPPPIMRQPIPPPIMRQPIPPPITIRPPPIMRQPIPPPITIRPPPTMRQPIPPPITIQPPPTMRQPIPPPTMRQPVPPPITITQKPVKIDYIGPPAKGKGEDCCICLEEGIVAPGKLTECKHAICQQCTQQLIRPECPLCRVPLRGGYLTEEAQNIINIQEKIYEHIVELRADAYKYYVDTHENLPTRQRHDNARTLSDAYELFIRGHPELNEVESRRIFDGFVKFVELEGQRDPTKIPYDLIEDFILIGNYMLESSVDFETIYQHFLRIQH